MACAPPIGTIEMASASRSRPRRSASVSIAHWSLLPSTSTTARGCFVSTSRIFTVVMHVETNGMRLWFDVDGCVLEPDGPVMRERPTVVLLHGGPGSFDHSYLKPDFARLSNVAQIVYLDLPGHGRSDHGDPATWSFE